MAFFRILKTICINVDDVSQKVPPLISVDEIKLFQTISYYSILFPKKCKRADERNDDIMIYRYSCIGRKLEEATFLSKNRF